MDLLAEERECYARGIRYIAGVDEVGRGCIAGPVYSAAVVLPQKFDLPKLNDSKKLSAKQRDILYDQIREQALAVEIASVCVAEIDRINIFWASLKAMSLALSRLEVRPDFVLVDGKFKVDIELPQKTLIKGDGRSASIAAASIVAKVSRDRFMTEQEKKYPGFNFGKHKGYGTAQHLNELKLCGPTPLHRCSFAPVRDCLEVKA